MSTSRSPVDPRAPTRIVRVAVPRGRTSAIIYAHDRERLREAIKGRSSAKVGAIDETLLRAKRAAIAPTPSGSQGRRSGESASTQMNGCEP